MTDTKSESRTNRRWALTMWSDPREKITVNDCQYFVTCREKAPSTDKVHWQSYVEFKTPVRIARIKKIFDDKTIHCEIAKADGPTNKKYCIKNADDENPFWEIGEMNHQGKRHDLAALKRKRDDGEMTLRDIRNEAPQLYAQYRNGWRDFEKDAQEKKARKFNVVEHIDIKVKTEDEALDEAAKYPDAFMLRITEKLYFDEYQGQDVLLLYGNGYVHIKDYVRPLAFPLPGRYTTTYPGWSKVVTVKWDPSY